MFEVCDKPEDVLIVFGLRRVEEALRNDNGRSKSGTSTEKLAMDHKQSPLVGFNIAKASFASRFTSTK